MRLNLYGLSKPGTIFCKSFLSCNIFRWFRGFSCLSNFFTILCRCRIKFSSRCLCTETGFCIFLRLLCRRGCILCVCVCSDLICKLLADRRTANHDLNPASEWLFQKCRHSVTKGRHCSGKKRRKCNNTCFFVLIYLINKSLDRHINAKIDHFEAGTFKHHSNQIFTDIMKISGNSSKDNRSCTSSLAGCKIWLQNFHTSLHSPGCCQHLWYENNLFLKVLANHCHGADHSVIEDCSRVAACIKCFLNSLSDFFIFSILS